MDRSNSGKTWTTESEQLLLILAKTHPLSVCAENLKRTESALVSRLKHIALMMHKNDQKSIDEICETTTLSSDVVSDLIYIDELPNHNAEWDESQDKWVQKYVRKIGVVECAAKMGRSPAEIEKRQIVLAFKAIDRDVPIEKTCKDLMINIDDFKDKYERMQKYMPFDMLDEVVDQEPPYYIILNGRRNGLYTDVEGFNMSKIGFDNAKFKRCLTMDEVRNYVGARVTSDFAALTMSLPPDTPVADTPALAPPKIVLSDQQKAVIDAVFMGHNILLLGSAGVGKSLVIKEVTRICKERSVTIGITSSTGCSAVLIDGRTIHSYLGIGLAKDSPTDLARKLFFKNKQKVSDLQELQILLIDEISMLDGDLLHKISTYLAIVRNCNKPFGGIQLILSGDFYQLPPVNGPFAFKSPIWASLNFSCHVLTKIYRQEGDTVFQGILERAKSSNVTNEDIRVLKACKGLQFKTDVKPTSLYSVNATVDIINKREYELLKGNEMVYNTIYANNETKAYCDNTKIPPFVKLKVGAQIMVTRNVNTELKLANGTRGVVTQMYEDAILINTLYGERVITLYDCVNETDKRIVYAVMPIALAWAVTIHKSQGITLDCCTIDIGESLFACGQAYTALSRVKSLNGLRVVSVTKSAFKTHPDVIEFYEAMQK
jgi:ATP-dependent DNA helicase PIF1